MPTLIPCLATAIAKLVVSDDLPTPPLPEEIPMTRVNESGLANGISFDLPPRTISLTFSRCASFITPYSRAISFTSASSPRAF